MDRIARINEMEEALDAQAALLDQLSFALDTCEASIGRLERLMAYYGSEEWFSDREADEGGELPDDLKRGVLTEDIPYELLTDARELALRMVETGVSILRVV